MTSAPSSLSSDPALTDEQTLSAAVSCLNEHLSMETHGQVSPTTLYEVLIWAASRHDSIEHTSEMLQGVPSGNGIRYHLCKLKEIASLEKQLNSALQSKLPGQIINRRQRLAIDLHLIHYYGKPGEEEGNYVYRSCAKSGTTRFFAYATVYVIRAHQRVTLAVHAVPTGETLVGTITYLLAAIEPLRVKVKRLYLERGFFCVPVIRWLLDDDMQRRSNDKFTGARCCTNDKSQPLRQRLFLQISLFLGKFRAAKAPQLSTAVIVAMGC